MFRLLLILFVIINIRSNYIPRESVFCDDRDTLQKVHGKNTAFKLELVKKIVLNLKLSSRFRAIQLT